MSEITTSLHEPTFNGGQPADINPVADVASYRKTVFHHTTSILLNDAVGRDDYRAGEFPRVAALLTSSIEELKVAEEHLIEQNAALLAAQEEHERRLAYERRLFDMASCALVVTDTVGGILEANRAAITLLGQDHYHLHRKPIASLVPREERSLFRKELSCLGVTQGASDWRFRICRVRDTAVQVSAAVQVVGGANKTGGAALFWSLRAIGEAATV
jgi:PAS domain-containing protein